MKATITGLMMMLVLAACSVQDVKQTDAGASEAKTTTAAEMGGTAMEQVEGEKVAGTVVEFHAAAGFTYVLLDSGKEKEWYVLGPIGLKKGEKLELETRMSAEKFESKSLKRTFDKVTFARVISGGTAVPVQPSQEHAEMMTSQMPAGHHGMSGDSPHGAMDATPTAADLGPINVAKAEGADARTVAEIWASRSSLGDRKVVVRGKVVKSLSGIMGKNWVHLRDGSGTPAKGDDDITVTTDGSAKVGDVVLVSGVVRVDKDFGSGYEYPVIIEDAKIQKQ